ncbi:hypothetical protein HXX76_014643 [Chlamydomonas incerta]|uniref:Uncharacterized protein n=1 Tax=Chlamydomonas incerta TaxID=51695 RepID=A0A835SIU8_CHLIN|nr:hypothetical protein HXX76_014643 [Chlamydomonas incerta]|eukprot:KAG2424263.1 hypothetical protein HXX76_014643 [Chlamydomonas incerta]
MCAGFKLSDVTGSSSNRTAMVAIDPTAPSTSAIASERSGPSIPIIALAVGAVGLAAIAFKKFRQNGLDDHTYRYSASLHLKDVMKDVNTVRIDDLTPEQIEAARARRSKERSANHRLCLEDVELPQNHPFATKQKLTQEQQDAALSNLRARSMRRRNYEAMQEGANGGGQGGMSRSR